MNKLNKIHILNTTGTMNLQYVDNPKMRYELRAERGSTEEHLTTYQQGRARELTRENPASVFISRGSPDRCHTLRS